MDKPRDGTSSSAAVSQQTGLASSRIQDRDLEDIRPSVPDSNVTPLVTAAPGPVALIPLSLASNVPSLGTVASNLGNSGTPMGPNGAAISQSGALFSLGSPLSLHTSLVPTTTYSPLGSAHGSQPGSNHSSNPTTGPTVTPAPAPTPTVATPSIAGSTGPAGMGSPYAPPMNQISMPYIKRHAVKRVKSAKEAANAELAKVIHSITNYFEERLGEREREEAEELYAKAQAQQHQQYMRDQVHHHHSQSPHSHHQSPQGHSLQASSTYQSPHVSAPPSQSQSHFHSHPSANQHSHTHHQPSHLSQSHSREPPSRSQSHDLYGSDGGGGDGTGTPHSHSGETQNAHLLIGSPAPVQSQLLGGSGPTASELHAAIQQLHNRRGDKDRIGGREGGFELEGLDGMTDADEGKNFSRSRTSSLRLGGASRSHSRQPSLSGAVNLRKTGSLHGKPPHSAPVAVPVAIGNSAPLSPGDSYTSSIYPTSLASNYPASSSVSSSMGLHHPQPVMGSSSMVGSLVTSGSMGPPSAPASQQAYSQRTPTESPAQQLATLAPAGQQPAQLQSPAQQYSTLSATGAQHSQGTLTPPSQHTQGQHNVSKRMSRHMFVPNQPSQPPAPRSGLSSRSTSRSRSPMPPPSNVSTEQATPASSSPKTANRRLSRHLDSMNIEPPPVDPFISTLHDLITVCTDIMETSPASLTSRPGIGGELVRKVQEVGRAWDEHPDWYGRTWYITVLLAVATLARVVEWFEAERVFWRWEEDEGDAEEEGGLTFVLKPEYESDFSGRDESVPKTPVAGRMGDDDNSLRLEKSREEGRMSRDERVPQKDLRGGVLVGDQGPTTSNLGVGSKPTSGKVTPAADKPIARDYVESQPPRSHTSTPGHSIGLKKVEEVKMEAGEHLRLKADKAKSSNILMELNLDGEHFLYINRTWADVIGSDPDTVVNTGQGISHLLHPEDVPKFKEASDKLQSDDSHTVEIQFRMRVEPDYDETQDLDDLNNLEPSYLLMEGSGMLMLDRIEAVPSHTMWVIKPAPEPTPEEEIELTLPEPSSGLTGRTPSTPFRFPLNRVSTENMSSVPVIKSLSATPILCRICENQIPSWFFEKHNETCNEVHKFEADIVECNESISELRNTVRELIQGIEKLGTNVEKSIPERPPLEYRGMSISTPSASATANSPIQVFRPPLASRLQRVGVRKAQQKLLEQMEEILTTAGEIAIPSLKEEESKEPIERQRLLSPTSEDRIGKCSTWIKPTPEDPALSRLVQDVDYLIKQKLDIVMRMQNTVRYSEKIRQEWTVKYEEALAFALNDPSIISESVVEEGADDMLQDEDGDDGASSTTSEYDFGRDKTSTEPTPVASSPMPSSAPLPMMPIMPVPVPATYAGVGAHKHSRSSTPSSVTSPLAIAAPINASTTPDLAAIDHAALLAAVEDSAQTIRARRISIRDSPAPPVSLEPKLLVTPPVSPSLGTTLAPISTAHARRHSIVQPILSPTIAVAPGPHHGRLPSVAPSSKAPPSSIKDFEIIKPISKGAFGSVFLAKKKTTGDYFAIKVLKKSDMIAKNQVTNVKAERMILMKQAESPFVVKLYFTFQSKDNLYLVMEYLNGGDCAALIKTIGALPEEWTRAYVAEVVLGLEFLHGRGIVHRDLKPDNLLIDQHGHLKLTDFGLSRIGLLGRQTRESRRLPERLLGGKAGRGRRSPGSRPTSFDSGYLQSPLLSAKIEDSGSYFNPRMAAAAQMQDDVSESSGSEGVAHMMWKRGKQSQADSPLQSFASELAAELRANQSSTATIGGTHAHTGSTPPGEGEKKFVGTPDYLAPETILGLSDDDRSVDWWALGVITYEFLYGIPPFHAESPDKVFENILSMRVDWHEDWIEFSQDARNFMERLMVFDPTKRLGYNGAQEVRAHTFFSEIEWDKVMQAEPQFVPQVTDPESTDYFDPRGAIPQLFQDDEAVAIGRPPSENVPIVESPSKVQGASAARGPLRDAIPAPAPDDFGTFNFKNLPVLKQANDEMIKKLKSEQMAVLGDAALIQHHRRRSMSRRINKPANVLTNFEPKGNTNPPSPSTSVSSIASSPSRGSMGPSTPGSVQAHMRRPSEYSAVDRFKMNQMEHDSRRNSMPSRLRTASVSSSDHDPNFSTTESWSQSIGSSATSASPAPEPTKRAPDAESVDRAVICLIAEDNPISAKILETLLVRLGCRCVMAADGAEAISTAHGDIKFDLILMDYHMPVVDGESAARYIKSTNNLNKSTPIVAVSAYVGQDSNVASNLFAACLTKPVHKADILNVLRQLGFRTSTTADGPKHATQVSKVAAAVS